MHIDDILNIYRINITALNKHADEKFIDDLEHIRIVGVVISTFEEAIENANYTQLEIQKYKESLVELARSVYASRCLNAREEAEDREEYFNEMEESFNYVYTNDKYPEGW